MKWMCDVIGYEPTSERSMEAVVKAGITPESLEEFIGQRGNLPTNVKEQIKKLGYTWTDSGGGTDSWHIGVPFDDFFDAAHYLLQMTVYFKTAIATGLLRFKLQTWSKCSWQEGCGCNTEKDKE